MKETEKCNRIICVYGLDAQKPQQYDRIREVKIIRRLFMAIDFKKRLNSKKIERKTNPVELYETLDRKSIAGPLRSSQLWVLNEWFKNRKEDRDLIIKLHTGEGKTLIGLLILQSTINNNEGPCLYVCPNKYLVNQVCYEAEKFGIPYCCFDNTNKIPDDFYTGKKLLITHAQKVFNGRSVFGIGNSGIGLGSILLDDSHSCVETIRSAFTITIDRKKNEIIYKQIFDLFYDDLIQQREGSCLDIENGDYDTFLTIPYWSWNEKRNEVLRLLSNQSNNDSIKYVWPLIRDKIKNYCCYISGTKVEITPYIVNIDEFSSFAKAKHRILMSATTQNDAFFIKGLKFQASSLKTPLINNNQKWSGEKMIIIPSLINENCD